MADQRVILTPDSIVRAARNSISCELDGEAAVLNIMSGNYYGLDAVSAAVWKIVEQPRTLAAIIREITSMYDVDPVRCKRDLIGLIGQLQEHGLVEISDML